jgi:hypothetical protein
METPEPLGYLLTFSQPHAISIPQCEKSQEDAELLLQTPTSTGGPVWWLYPIQPYVTSSISSLR